MTKREKQILVIVLVLGFLWYTGILQQLSTGLQSLAGGGVYYGNVKITLAESNKYDGSSESTSSAAYTAYHGSTGYKGVTGTSISASGTTFEASLDDKGYIYMKIYAGTGHYVDAGELARSNARMEDIWYEDIDNDSVKDLMTKIYVGDIGVRGQASDPILALNLPLIPEDVAVDCSSPSDDTGVGETEVVRQVEWKISGVTEKKGFVIARVYVTSNVSQGGDDIRFEELTISGLGVEMSWSNPESEVDGNYTGYYYSPTDYREISNGIWAERGVNKADAMYITLNVRCTFETNDQTAITLNLEVIDSDSSVADTEANYVAITEA